MGEFADMAIDEMLSMDFYQQMHPDEFDDEPDMSWSPFTRFRGPKPKTCKYCGKQALFWGQDDKTGRWRLEDLDIENDEWIPHICKMKERWKFNTNTGTSSRQTRDISRTV